LTILLFLQSSESLFYKYPLVCEFFHFFFHANPDRLRTRRVPLLIPPDFFALAVAAPGRASLLFVDGTGLDLHLAFSFFPSELFGAGRPPSLDRDTSRFIALRRSLFIANAVWSGPWPNANKSPLLRSASFLIRRSLYAGTLHQVFCLFFTRGCRPRKDRSGHSFFSSHGRKPSCVFLFFFLPPNSPPFTSRSCHGFVEALPTLWWFKTHPPLRFDLQKAMRVSKFLRHDCSFSSS